MKHLTFLLAVAASAQSVTPRASKTGTPPEHLCRVEGKAVDAHTGSPLSRVQISLRKISNANPGTYVSVTDGMGHFELDELDPGRYLLFGARNGYLLTTYGSTGTNRRQTAITLRNAQILKDLVLPLLPQGIIAGRVTDEENEALARATVVVLKYSYMRGRKHLVEASRATTNDLGEYRAFGLGPGRYYVTAVYQKPGFFDQGAATVVGPPQARAAMKQAYAQTYYPNSTTPESASAITLQPGTQTQGMDIKLELAHVYNVRGRVPEKSSMPGRAMLMLMRRDSVFDQTPAFADLDRDGAFEFRGVPAGSYVIASDLTDHARTLSARVPIEVTNSDVEGLEIEYMSLPALRGRVVAENKADLKDLHLDVELSPPSGSLMNNAPYTTMNSDFSFKIENLAPEIYALAVTGLPKNFYVKSVRFGGGEVVDSRLDLTLGVGGDLKVLISGAGATVEGSVQNAEQKPVPGSTVVLVPDTDKRGSHDLYYYADGDQDGHFVVQGVRPGDYKLFAWEQVDYGAAEDAEFMRPVETKGEAISLKENSHETVQLTAIPADDAAANAKP